MLHEAAQCIDLVHGLAFLIWKSENTAILASTLCRSPPPDGGLRAIPPHGVCMSSAGRRRRRSTGVAKGETMKRHLALLLALAVVGTFPLAAQRGPEQHAHPRANQGHPPPAPAPRRGPAPSRQPEVERFDGGRMNGVPHVNHDRWYGHDRPDDPRFHQTRVFEHGRFGRGIGPSHRWAVSRFDRVGHRFWLGSSAFLIAPWDWALADRLVLGLRRRLRGLRRPGSSRLVPALQRSRPAPTSTSSTAARGNRAGVTPEGRRRGVPGCAVRRPFRSSGPARRGRRARGRSHGPSPRASPAAPACRA